MREAVLQQEIRLALGQRDDVMLFRINVGKFRPLDGGPRVIQSAPEGTPDLLGVLRCKIPGDLMDLLIRELSDSTMMLLLDWLAKRGGQGFGVEVKTDVGRQRTAQVAWQNAWEKRGGIYILARSLDDVYRGLDITP